jgi:SAM-dependent methyltransferase
MDRESTAHYGGPSPDKLNSNTVTPVNIPSIHQETGAFWDEIADTYAERDERNATAFLQSGGNYLLASEREKLGDLKLWCKRAIHLQCSHGNDALSLLRQGAQEVVGVDISERLLAVARRKTQALGAAATWHCADILQTPEVLNGTADLVYTGKGALCWMMDLSAWAKVVARLLAPGGKLYIYEAHPLNWLWDLKASQYVLDPKHGSYFSNELKEGLFSRKTKFMPRGHQWTLGEIVNTVIESGMRIEQLNEYPEPFWDEFPNMPAETLHRLPHTFDLRASKP